MRVSHVLGPVLGPTYVTFLKLHICYKWVFPPILMGVNTHEMGVNGCSLPSHGTRSKETEGVKQFPIAATTNYHKLNGLKQHERIVL